MAATRFRKSSSTENISRLRRHACDGQKGLLDSLLGKTHKRLHDRCLLMNAGNETAADIGAALPGASVAGALLHNDRERVPTAQAN